MSADRIFFEHSSPDERTHTRPKRKRRARFIDELSPEVRQRLAECIDQFSPKGRCQFQEVATTFGIPIEFVMFYSGVLFILTRACEQTVQDIRDHGLLPEADDDEIRAAIAECRRDLKAEMNMIRRKR